MGLTVLPTRTAGSLGVTKVNARPMVQPTREVSADEWNALCDAVIAIATAVGLADGTTTGSVVAALPFAQGRINAAGVLQGAGLNIDGVVHTSTGVYTVTFAAAYVGHTARAPVLVTLNDPGGDAGIAFGQITDENTLVISLADLGDAPADAPCSFLVLKGDDFGTPVGA